MMATSKSNSPSAMKSALLVSKKGVAVLACLVGANAEADAIRRTAVVNLIWFFISRGMMV
jgi:hypothetical protein